MRPRVDDIAQDTFLTAYRKWQASKPLENPGAWLRVIAKNLVLNELAKSNRRQRLLDENVTTLLMAAAGDTTSELHDRDEDRAALNACLDQLTDKARCLIESRYYRGRTSAEMGSEFAMKPTAVRKMLFHARHSLGECLRLKLAPPA